MKKLLLIFVGLLGIAVAATVAGILASRRAQGAEDGATVLVWKVDGPVLEQEVPRLPFSGAAEPDSIAQLYPAFRAARQDSGIKGLAVYIQNAELGLAKAQELRRQMMALRRAGKFVECYLETAGEGSNGTLAYYLATACERIHLSPVGEVNLLGLSWESRLWRGTLDKLKIDPQFNRVGRYKSAVEIYTQTRLTPEAQEAVAAVLDGYFSQIVSAVAEARRKSESEVRELIDAAPYDAEAARKRGLVDDLLYPDQFLDRLKKRLGRRPSLLPIEEYRPEPAFAGKQIAIVFALGTIVRGDGGTAPWTEESYLGSDKTAEVLRTLRDDDSVAAVVLRIDSPGGSALASDLILRQVERLKKRKPVVVSMSDTAASGGYYIAAKATKIVAEPATLTGSIGVFGGKFVTRRFEEEVLGIGHDLQKRGANADIYSELQTYSPQQEALVQQLLDRTYATFVGHVAAGRKMSREAVEEVAGGRVWTGAAAQKIGLVDELGGLDSALELAQAAAGIGAREAVALDFYPSPPTWLDIFLVKREPRLPGALAEIVKRLETTPPRLLELPPELARLSRPF
jgi:protease IV